MERGQCDSSRTYVIVFYSPCHETSWFVVYAQLSAVQKKFAALLDTLPGE
jgi:hypothetical protein